MGLHISITARDTPPAHLFLSIFFSITHLFEMEIRNMGCAVDASCQFVWHGKRLWRNLSFSMFHVKVHLRVFFFFLKPFSRWNSANTVVSSETCLLLYNMTRQQQLCGYLTCQHILFCLLQIISSSERKVETNLRLSLKSSMIEGAASYILNPAVGCNSFSVSVDLRYYTIRLDICQHRPYFFYFLCRSIEVCYGSDFYMTFASLPFFVHLQQTFCQFSSGVGGGAPQFLATVVQLAELL